MLVRDKASRILAKYLFNCKPEALLLEGLVEHLEAFKKLCNGQRPALVCVKPLPHILKLYRKEQSLEAASLEKGIHPSHETNP